jgi:NTE family protein
VEIPDQAATLRASTKAVVLGGGGPVGRAWETGFAAGLLIQGVDLADADRIIGTSAGAIAGAQIALRLDIGAAVGDPSAGPAVSQDVSAGLQQLIAACARAATSPTPEIEWQQIGRMALAANTSSEETNLARPTFAAITGREWPSNFWTTSHSARTGRFQVWSAASKVPLERAVASSAALPGMWPPITIGDDRYMDGGVRSMLNADLASGYANVVVLSCFALTSPQEGNGASATLNRALLHEVDLLRRGGAVVEVATPNEEFQLLTKNGTAMLNGALVPDAYAVGKRQALDAIERVGRVWRM